MKKVWNIFLSSCRMYRSVFCWRVYGKGRIYEKKFMLSWTECLERQTPALNLIAARKRVSSTLQQTFTRRPLLFYNKILFPSGFSLRWNNLFGYVKTYSMTILYDFILLHKYFYFNRAHVFHIQNHSHIN